MTGENMKSQSIENFGAPLVEVTGSMPQPKNSEIVVEVSHCGVCHSDVHMHDGYFDLGGGQKLDVTGGRAMPFTLGHEMEGRVAAVGPDVRHSRVGDRRVIYPWIGCGACPPCQRGQDQLCARPEALGVMRNGGYATHCLVPDERYALDPGNIAPGLAGIFMCGGLTAYTALRRITDMTDEPVLLVGLGGVGMMGLQFALNMLDVPVFVTDIDAEKRRTALAAGATEAFDPQEEGSLKNIIKMTQGGVGAAIDFVGADNTLAMASGAIRKGGKMVVTGMLGGKLTIPAAILAMRSIQVFGSYTGSLEDTKEMLETVKKIDFNTIPLDMRPLNQATKALDDLRAGKVMGRVVLTPGA